MKLTLEPGEQRGWCFLTAQGGEQGLLWDVWDVLGHTAWVHMLQAETGLEAETESGYSENVSMAPYSLERQIYLYTVSNLHINVLLFGQHVEKKICHDGNNTFIIDFHNNI